MAFTPCSAALSGNIASDCSNIRIAGYEQTGLIFNRDDIDFSSSTVDSANGRIVTGIKLKSNKKPYVIYNSKNNPLPFDGTQTEYDSDNDVYNKTVQFYFEGIGGDAAADVVEPLKGGQYVVLLQRKDHRGNGSFQLMGWQTYIKATAEVQTESTGSAYWLITMEGSEPSAEVAFFDTDYETTLTAYEALLATV